MGIAFDESRWERVKENSRAWWAGELGRPMIFAPAGGKDPGRPEPGVPNYAFAAFYDLSIPAEVIVDRWDYDLSCTNFLGDAFPQAWPNFGPGVAAAFIGATLMPDIPGYTCWFEFDQDIPIQDMHFEYNPDNIWFHRLADIYRAAISRWEGRVQVGMTDLGGAVDILSTFRKGEKLMYDLYDYPEEVKRVTWELHDIWWKYFEEFNKILQPVNPGHTAWAAIFSEPSYYMLQCDFCYMIGPDMFDEFVKPELAASCKKLGNAFYHLDGPGQLPHLDSLLTIPDLKGVQWVPGAGAPGWEAWPEVYKKIRAAGKKMQVYANTEVLDGMSSYLGTLDDVYVISAWLNPGEAARMVEKYG